MLGIRKDDNFEPYVKFKHHWEEEVKKAGSVDKAPAIHNRITTLSPCFQHTMRWVNYGELIYCLSAIIRPHMLFVQKGLDNRKKSTGLRFAVLGLDHASAIQHSWLEGMLSNGDLGSCGAV